MSAVFALKFLTRCDFGFLVFMSGSRKSFEFYNNGATT